MAEGRTQTNNTECMQIIILDGEYRKTLIRAFAERLSIVKSWKQPEMIMTVDIAEEILYLLKWQEKEIEKDQEPKPIADIADSVDGMEVGRFPSCDRAIVNKKSDSTRYCKFCGQEVKWDA